MHVREGKDIQSILISLIFGPTCNGKISSTLQPRMQWLKKVYLNWNRKIFFDFEIECLETPGWNMEVSTQMEKEWSGRTAEEREGDSRWGKEKREKKKKSKLCLILLRHMIFTICLLSITNICAKNKQERSDWISRRPIRWVKRGWEGYRVMNTEISNFKNSRKKESKSNLEII